MQIVAVIADRADDFEPGRVVLLQLGEAAGNGPQAAWRGDVGITAAVGGFYVILKRIDAERDRVAPVADIEPRGIVDVDSERIEYIAALVADAAGNVVAEAAAAIG